MGYRKCINCKKRAIFDIQGGKGIYCDDHKLKEMINIKSKKCEKINCPNNAYYGIKGDKPLFCSLHKFEGMIDLKNRRCEYMGCDLLSPSYNFPNQKTGKFCVTHKFDGMINVISKRCEFLGCDSLSYCFDFENGKGKFCSTHKVEGMINVHNKRCEYDGCKTLSRVFDFINGKGRFCSKHKLEGMINVIDKKCEFENCKVYKPCYDYKNGTGRFCSKHKLEGMENVYNIKCEFKGCLITPNFNFKNKKAILCSEHKKEGMVNVKTKQCKTEFCETIATKKYKGFCFRCYIHTFPDEKVSRNYKTKERAVADFVREKNTDVKITFDKIISGGCSRKRPDILMDFHTHVLIIEVDENQHEGYTCENKRIMEISQDLGHPHIVFIRFNPDSYQKEEKKILSCWKIDKRGLCVVKDKKQWDERLNTLQQSIEKYKTNIPDRHITIEQLYFS